MSEQDRMDRLLREMMAITPPPCLSSGFEQRLRKRLGARRLDSAGRWILTGYGIIALILSIWVMRSQSIDWSLVAIAIVVPLSVATVIQHRRLTPMSTVRER